MPAEPCPIMMPNCPLSILHELLPPKEYSFHSSVSRTHVPPHGVRQEPAISRTVTVTPEG